MKNKKNDYNLSLFPFLSVLLSTLGVLAFLSISFLFTIPTESSFKEKKIEYKIVGSPNNIEPVIIKCYEKKIEYFDIFENSIKVLSVKKLINQIENENSELVQYFFEIVKYNKKIKSNFGEKEYYPLLLIYPKGVYVSDILLNVIEYLDELNVGLEPMKSNWDVPYIK